MDLDYCVAIFDTLEDKRQTWITTDCIEITAAAVVNVLKIQISRIID